MPDQPPPRAGGMSGLYANLLGEVPSSATISAAPVVFNRDSNHRPSTADDTPSQKKINAAALRFQPVITKRPTVTKAKAPISIKPPVSAPETVTKPIVKTTIDDWVGDDEDVNGFYNAPAKDRPRGGRKKRKKNRATPPPPTNWDDPYDPMRPNSYEEYREGDEKIREMQDWRDRLYGKKRRMSYDSSSEDERRPPAGGRFAPPSSYSFAPPPQFASNLNPLPSPPPPVAIPDDASGEDAFARRMRMSQQGAVGYSGIPLPPPTDAAHHDIPSPLPPPPGIATPPPPPPPPAAPIQLPPPPPPAATISAAPVLYNAAAPAPASPPPRSPSPEPDAPASSLPGQKGFAQRLLEKQGWKAGQGLGKEGRGITKAIQMVAAKGKDNKGRGKIIDKNKRPVKPADRSEVVVLRGIIDGWKGEMEDGELMQKVGDEYKRYGRVVQIVIRWDEGGEEDGGTGRVYVLFANEESAQMAVDGLRRREIFEGNTTTASFYPKPKFEAREFDE